MHLNLSSRSNRSISYCRMKDEVRRNVSAWVNKQRSWLRRILWADSSNTSPLCSNAWNFSQDKTRIRWHSLRLNFMIKVKPQFYFWLHLGPIRKFWSASKFCKEAWQAHCRQFDSYGRWSWSTCIPFSPDKSFHQSRLTLLQPQLHTFCKRDLELEVWRLCTEGIHLLSSHIFHKLCIHTCLSRI